MYRRLRQIDPIYTLILGGPVVCDLIGCGQWRRESERISWAGPDYGTNAACQLLAASYAAGTLEMEAWFEDLKSLGNGRTIGPVSAGLQAEGSYAPIREFACETLPAGYGLLWQDV